MQGFEPVTLSWQGKDYTVPAERQMGLIARIEDALSGPGGEQALNVLFRREGPPYSRLASAFGAALRYAGAQVSDEDVYLSIMEDIASGGGTKAAEKLLAATSALLNIMAPPLRVTEAAEAKEKATDEKKDQPAAS